jgi:hypothetical protein
MLASPEVAGVFSGHNILFNGRCLAPQFREKGVSECKANIDHFQMPAHDPTAMYRMSMVKGIPYGPTLGIADGLDYTLRVGEQFPLRVVGECLYSYRVHLSSITKRDPSRRDRMVEIVLRRACERRGVPYEEAVLTHAVRRRGKHQRADNNLAADFIESVLDQRRAGMRGQAIATGCTCSCLHPLEMHYHKALVYAFAPMSIVHWLRRPQS